MADSVVALSAMHSQGSISRGRCPAPRRSARSPPPPAAGRCRPASTRSRRACGSRPSRRPSSFLAMPGGSGLPRARFFWMPGGRAGPGSSSRGCRRGSPVPRRRRYAVPSPSCRRRCPSGRRRRLLPGPPWLSWPPWLPLLPLLPFPPSIWLPCGLPLPLPGSARTAGVPPIRDRLYDQREHRTSVEHMMMFSPCEDDPSIA